VPLANTTDGRKIPDHFERICVENNGGFGRGAAPASTASTVSPVTAPSSPPAANP